MKAEEIFEPLSLEEYAEEGDEALIKDPGTGDESKKRPRIKKTQGSGDASKKKNNPG